jgi:hypothetical protein
MMDKKMGGMMPKGMNGMKSAKDKKAGMYNGMMKPAAKKVVKKVMKKK